MGIKGILRTGGAALVATASVGAASGAHEGLAGILREGAVVPVLVVKRVAHSIYYSADGYFKPIAQAVDNVQQYPLETLAAGLTLPAAILLYYGARSIGARRASRQAPHTMP